MNKQCRNELMFPHELCCILSGNNDKDHFVKNTLNNNPANEENHWTQNVHR